ncbi:MAG: hypothetical protein MZV70_34670 [Desulfobacterales bacterium]|nr:hypothetical protein [Desulfobacterales bacterium]
MLSEGAAVLVIEALESALSRNAPVYGEVIGYSNTTDAFHITSRPAGTGSRDGAGHRRSGASRPLTSMRSARTARQHHRSAIRWRHRRSGGS